MKTYAETQGEEVFDWNAALQIPYSEMTDEKISKMEDLSNDWVTCACGNQCEIIPRKDKGEPKDEYLVELGCAFYLQISNMRDNFNFGNKLRFESNRAEAIEILHKIELRSAELIKEIQGS